MTTYNTTQMAAYAATPQQLPTAENGYGARELAYITSITYNSQASGSIIAGPIVPKGKVVRSISLQSSVSTGSATLTAGNAGTPAKYLAATAITTPGAAISGNLAMQDPPVASTNDEQIFATVGTAALPASGVLWIVANVASI